MSTYYDYREVGVMIAHKLMNMEGWKVYGYKADESDSMTDYYSPAYWNGVAEKMVMFSALMFTELQRVKKSANIIMTVLLIILVLRKKLLNLSA